MESSSLSVQNQQFQIVKLPTNDVPKQDVKGEERIAAKSKPEFGSNKHCRAINSAEFDCIYNFGEPSDRRSQSPMGTHS